MKQKGFALLLIVLLIVVLGVVGYLGYKNYKSKIQTLQFPIVISTPIDMLNWKILFNENGYSIKYPSSLKVLGGGFYVDETKSDDVIIASNPGNPKDISPALHINVWKKSTTVFKDMTLTEISKANYEANLADKNTFKQVVVPLKLISFDNKQAYTYTIIANAFAGKWSSWILNATVNRIEKLTMIESENNDNYFIIVYSADDPTITSILSTFKFTN